LSSSNFDLEALLRTVAIALGITLIGKAIGDIAAEKKKIATFLAGISLLLTVAVYYAWPKPTLLLAQPKTGQKIHCLRTPDGIYKCTIKGWAAGFLPGQQVLLLWVKPVNPASGGWYLQCARGSVIRSLDANGSWSGLVQIGNLDYPPHEGDIVDFAVTLAETDVANHLLSELPTVIVHGSPVGIKSDIAREAILTLQ